MGDACNFRNYRFAIFYSLGTYILFVVYRENNIDSDVVFIETRENSFKEYGVVDGPVDMCIAYSYSG